MSRPTNAGLRGLLLVLSGNMLLDALEVSKAVVALPSVGRGLAMPFPQLQWIMGGFAVGFGATLLFAGRMVERFGRRRAYLAALAVFAAAAGAGALAESGPALILTRFVQGACAALTAPTGLAIIAATYEPGERRDRALSVYALFGASGFAFGLVASGVLTEWSWRWVFAAPAPVALALLVAAARLIPADQTAGTPRPPSDWPGAVGLFALVVAGIYGVGRAADSGWTDPWAVGALLLCAVAAWAWVAHERRAPRGLLDLRLLRNSSLMRSAGGAAAMNGSYWGFLFVATLRLQLAHGWSPLPTAAILLPASVLPAVSGSLSRRLRERYTTERLILAGAVAGTAGYCGYLVLCGTSADTATLVAALVLVGGGFVLCFAALHMQATSAIPAPQRAMGTGVYQTAVQLGGATCLALVSATLTVQVHRSGPASALAEPRLALAVCAAVAAAGLVVAVTGIRLRRAVSEAPTQSAGRQGALR